MPLYDLPNDPPMKPKSKKLRKKKEVVDLVGVQELIKRRRLQMITHSAIYYHLDTNIIDDHTWQAWADELAELQNKHPEHCNIGWYDDAFKNWDGATGMHLPFNPNIHAHAEWLVKIHESYD